MSRVSYFSDFAMHFDVELVMPRYIDQTPATINSETVVIPWGAIEWHGNHLPFGVDGIIAESFATRLGDLISATVLPVQWSAMTTLPHRHSLSISTETFRRLVDETISSVVEAGAERVLIISGHYAQGHMIELYEASQRAMARFDIPIFTATPLEPLNDHNLLDHAGRSETSQVLAIQPESLNLDGLPAELAPATHAVLGEHPNLGSADEGVRLFDQAIQAWLAWLSDPLDLNAHYQAAIGQYDDYRTQFYRESWEQAIRDWWATKA